MKHLVKHLLRNNRQEMLEKSFLNCHVVGLHSIMLLSSPERTIRVFVATKEHEMWKNFPTSPPEEMSLAFHPHHCNITLHCTMGRLYNWKMQKSDESFPNSVLLPKYLYKSKIKQGETAFTKIGEEYLETHPNSRWLFPDESVDMFADDIHTVACNESEEAAWLVYEGKENPEYSSVCWSGSNPDNGDFSNLYKKPEEPDIFRLLNIANLL